MGTWHGGSGSGLPVTTRERAGSNRKMYDLTVMRFLLPFFQGDTSRGFALRGRAIILTEHAVSATSILGKSAAEATTHDPSRGSSRLYWR